MKKINKTGCLMRLDLGLKNKTVLIVAHRLSTVSICDEVVKLDKGKIIQK